jgi:PLP dependent protein
MKIKENLIKFRASIPEHVSLVVVSKTKTASEILEAYRTGQRIFGENKTRELQSKYQVLSKDIEWHYIGHLQTNKVKYIAPFVHLVESIDSLKILEELNDAGLRCNRIINCLLQFHIATESTKYGLNMEEAEQILSSDSYKKMKNIALCGVMGMATFTEDQQLIRSEFRALHSYFDDLKERYFREQPGFREISMGMSGDYQIAIEEGSTMIRIGSAIFGTRA